MANEEEVNTERSVLKELTVMLSMIGSSVGLLSFISTDWATPDYEKESNRVKKFGLWKVCRHVNPVETNRIGCFSLIGRDLPSWFTATQFLVTVGFILQIFTVILLVASICIPRYRKSTYFSFTYIAAGVGATIFLAVGLLLFHHKMHLFPVRPRRQEMTPPNVRTYQPYWAFYSMAAGTAVIPICVVLIIANAIIEYRKAEERTSISGQEGTHNYGSIETESQQ